MKKVIFPMCGVLFFGGCGPVAYQPRPIVYNNMPAAQQIVQYENSNPFLQNQKPMQNIQAETQPQHEQNTKILPQQKKLARKKSQKLSISNRHRQALCRNKHCLRFSLGFQLQGINPKLAV